MTQRGGLPTDVGASAFADALSAPDVALATRLLRAAVLETSSGRYASSSLRSALYGEYLMKLLDRAFGEHADFAAPPTATCWWDAVDGCRLMLFREARARGNEGVLATMSTAEAARCQASARVAQAARELTGCGRRRNAAGVLDSSLARTSLSHAAPLPVLVAAPNSHPTFSAGGAGPAGPADAHAAAGAVAGGAAAGAGAAAAAGAAAREPLL